MEEVRRFNKKGQAIYTVTFNGREYNRYPYGKHPNYYFDSGDKNGKKKRLHHAVYEYYKGEIPKGMVVHHIDFNPLNNEIDNLALVSRAEHMRIHDEFGKYREKHPEHLSKIGFSRKNWHERRISFEKELQKERRICIECGKEFIPQSKTQKYCSPSCYKHWQNHAECNNVEFECAVCGKKFVGNKYRKPKTCSSECSFKLAVNNRRKNKK